jgi:hypothetical protein
VPGQRPGCDRVDRPVPVEGRREIVPAEQREDRDGHEHLRGHPVRRAAASAVAAPPVRACLAVRASLAVDEQVAEHVRTQLGERAHLVRTLQVRGEFADPVERTPNASTAGK